MSGPIDNGGPAFPNTGNSTWNLPPDAGMSLRDWFAGQALASIITAKSAGHHDPKRAGSRDVVSGMAADAYELADAMIAARKIGGAA